jgi:secreted trypsin-like serine protease
MRKRLFAALAAALVGLGVAAPAQAVTNGQPDNGAHPFVGLVVFYNSAGAPTHRCTGTMISARTLLTAAHCTYGAASAQVWFDENVQRPADNSGYPFAGGFTGKPHAYSQYSGALTLPDTGDVGVVVLDVAPGLGAATVASVGTLDQLARNQQHKQKFTVVGYGLQDIRPTEMAARTRLRATTRLVNLNSALTDGFNIHQTAAPGTGGGTCFGDSGGPVFLQGTYTIVGVNSFVLNQNCAGAGFAYRVDTAGANAFIRQFTG